MNDVKKNQIIQRINNYVKNRLTGEGTGHDWWHTDRVRKLSLQIAKKEKANLFIVEIAALLHDVYDWKFYKESTRQNNTQKLLTKAGADLDTARQILYIVNNISYKGGTNKHKIETKEGMIVQDADRIDALGAIGIARAFAYGGKIAREIYNPNIKPKKYKNLKEYNKHLKTNPTINHFYEKILLLKNTMNTKAGRQIAKDRHQYTEKFLNRFFKEWEAKL